MVYCQSIGCEMPGRKRRDCRYCAGPIIRCGWCHERYERISVCRFCSEGDWVWNRGKRKLIPTHPDEERDEDANGWLSNARKHLEEER